VPQDGFFFIFSKASTSAVGPTKPAILGVLGEEREAHHSVRLYVHFPIRLHGVNRDGFDFFSGTVNIDVFGTGSTAEGVLTGNK
jgi:hypothetical protein